MHRPTTLTAGDWVLLRLPDALFSLHYLLRPIRLYVGRPIRPISCGACCRLCPGLSSGSERLGNGS